MRIVEVYEKCKKEETEINNYITRIKKYYESGKTNDESSKQKFNNVYESFYNYLTRKLGDISYLNETLKEMQSILLNLEFNPKPDYMMKIIELISTKIECIISFYETMKNKDKGGIGLDIKIPQIDNITDLKKCIDSLEFVFTKCPFFQSDEASLKLQGVDSGSIWLIFYVAGSVTVGSVLLNNIAAFIDKCFVIKSHKLTCDRQEQEIKSAEIAEKEKEELLKNIQRLYEISVKNAIKELEESTECYINDGDEMGRVEQSFEKMGKLLEQGLQIYSSIDSPEDVKVAFEPLEMHYIPIEKKLKQIEEKTDLDTE